jgi:TRAP-type uncharacterized transport system fused permease subunit
MAGKKHVLHSLHHLITGGALILKGITKISHHAFIGGAILLFGVLILAFFFYTLSRKHLSNNLELMVRWFEALVSLFTAYIFFTEGKTFLPYVFLLASIGFFISIYVFYRKKKSVPIK